MLRILLFLFGINFFATTHTNSQTASVGIGTTTPNNSAALEIQSNSKGLLLSRMTTAQRNAIVNPAIGLLVFDTEKNCFYLYDGNGWRAFAYLSGDNLPLIERQPNDGQIGNSFGATVAI